MIYSVKEKRYISKPKYKPTEDKPANTTIVRDNNELMGIIAEINQAMAKMVMPLLKDTSLINRGSLKAVMQQLKSLCKEYNLPKDLIEGYYYSFNNVFTKVKLSKELLSFITALTILEIDKLKEED